MTRLFKRNLRLSVWHTAVPDDGEDFETPRLSQEPHLRIDDMRVQFSIERSLTKTPNTCDVQIYNLAERSRVELEQKPIEVQLEAGYDGAYRLMYVGDLRFSMSEIKGAEWETLLQLGDGDRSHVGARVNRSYREGVRIRTVLIDIASSMGYRVPKSVLADPGLDQQFLTGVATYGAARDELERVLAPLGYTYSVQNKTLQILRDDDARETDPIEISEQTGMIGTPEFGSPPRNGKKPPHVTVQMLLYPEIVPGDTVNLNSRHKKGKFKVQRVKHNGDTHGKDWTTHLEILPLS